MSPKWSTALALVTISLPSAVLPPGGAAQQGGSTHSSSSVALGFRASTGEEGSLDLSLRQGRTYETGSWAFTLESSVALHRATSSEWSRDPSGELHQRKRRVNQSLYEVLPTFRRNLSPSWYLAVDFDWKRNPPQRIEHELQWTGGVGTSRKAADASMTRRLEVRAGYRREEEADEDVNRDPVAGFFAQESRRFTSGALMDLTAEALANPLDAGDLRTSFKGRLSVPIGGNFNLRADGEVTFRNQATEILVEPFPDQYDSYSVQGLSSRVDVSLEYRR